MKITVVTPTIMRASLRDTIAAVAECLLPGDEHLIIRDCTAEPRDFTVADSPPTNEYTLWYESSIPHSRFGNGQRDCGIQLARGDCIVFIDDDDLPCKPAFDVLHNETADQNTCHLFPMFNVKIDRVYTTDDLTVSNIGGPQMVVPNRKDLPKWLDANDYTSDFYFIQRTSEMPGMWLKHHPEIICRVDGQSFGK